MKHQQFGLNVGPPNPKLAALLSARLRQSAQPQRVPQSCAQVTNLIKRLFGEITMQQLTNSKRKTLVDAWLYLQNKQKELEESAINKHTRLPPDLSNEELAHLGAALLKNTMKHAGNGIYYDTSTGVKYTCKKLLQAGAQGAIWECEAQEGAQKARVVMKQYQAANNYANVLNEMIFYAICEKMQITCAPKAFYCGFCDSASPVIFMEYFASDLLEHVTRYPYEQDEVHDQSGVVSAFRSILKHFGILAEQIRFLHSALGVIIKDIKLENILVEYCLDGRTISRLVLCDFGMASLFGASSASAGTLTTMSPENLLQFKQTHKSDVYSLGLTLMQALFQFQLFGEAEEAGAHLEQTLIQRIFSSDFAEQAVDLFFSKFKSFPQSDILTIQLKELFAGMLEFREHERIDFGKVKQIVGDIDSCNFHSRKKIKK